MNFRPASVYAALVTLVMLGITGMYWRNEEIETEHKHVETFEAASDQLRDILKLRLDSYELVLRGVKGYVEGSKVISKEQFQSYTAALDLSSTRPGLQGIAVVSSVLATDLDSHVLEMQRGGHARYRVKPDGMRAAYAPIVLIAPYAGANLNAVGFDVMTNPQANAALEHARDAGSMALTGKTRLVQDAGADLPAAVMYLPIYAPGARQSTVEERRAAIAGWVSGPFRVSDLVNGLDEDLHADIALSIYDGTAATEVNRLYFPDHTATGGALQTTRTLALGGRQWTVVMHAKPEFSNRFADQSHWVIALIGGALSVIAGWLIRLLGNGKELAQKLASAMTQELREAHTDMDTTLDAMPDALFELDLTGRYYNYRTSRMNLLAAPPEVFLGKQIADVLPADATALCLEALQEAYRNGYSAGTRIAIPFEGQVRWFELSVARKAGAPTQDAQQARFIMISRDITETVQSQLQLQNERNFNNAVLDNAGALLVVMDSEGRVRRFNRAAQELSGLSAAEVEGKYPWETFLPPDVAEKVRVEAFEGLARQTEIRNANFTNEWINRNGQRFLIEWANTLLLDANGKMEFMVAIGVNVTERQRAQLALQTTVKEKTALLNEVHHRVKNNLQVISSLLRMESSRSAHAPTKDVLNDMQARIRSMAMLHETVYRNGAFAVVELGQYVREIATQAMRISQGSGSAIGLQLELEKVEVNLDQAMPCGLIVSELVSNCLKHGFPDGRAGEVSITLRALADQVQLSLRDSGVGLPTDFDDRKAKSLGVQLTESLAMQLGGTITVEPASALFTLVFPANPPD